MAVARGRDNAGGAWSNAVFGICMFLAVTAVMVQCAQAGVEHLVGGTQHWAAPGLFNAFNNTYLNDWASTQTFVTGDTLLFRFPTGYHTVEQVTEASYQDCNTANPIARWVTGNDTVPLDTPGTLYFICSISNHCAARGQKVMITVKSTASPSSSPNAGTHSSSLPAPPAAMASGALFVAACISLFW
ncbi:unnamed protein product [Sphagnum troendelagicum]|uniref:Phytocyanin domain-containing protein n=1 Tax=Sphagnum troendelagicum TaxID=128251 RepID=A0ABP0UBX6_9BRYO